mgnify:CR=1 FL=1
MEFNFKKEIYTTPELLKEGWLAKGNCLSDMGKFTLKGSKRSYWLIRKFMSWLIETQVNEKKTFNNEVRDQQIAIGALKGIKNEQK